MRQLAWTRTEFRDRPRKRRGALLDFVLDVPYLLFLGLIPPRHVMNEVLLRGGGDGGMSPGAIWERFELDCAEYEELVLALRTADLQTLRVAGRSRYVPADW